MNFIGFVEHVDNMRIRGWVFSPDDDAAHLTVVATVDDIDIGSAVADIMRKDLGELGFGRGDHAFEIVIVIPIRAEDCDAVEVSVVDPEGVRKIIKRVAGTPAPVPAGPFLDVVQSEPAGGRDHQDGHPSAMPVAATPGDDLLAGRATDPLADIDPFAGIDLQRDPPPTAPEAAAQTDDLLAGRVTDPLADVDPFAGIDLRRDAPPTTPEATALAEDLLAGRTSDPLADIDPFAGSDLQRDAPPVVPAAVGGADDLLAARATDPLADVDPFADLDLQRDAKPAPSSSEVPQPPPPAIAAQPVIGLDPVAANLQIFVLGAARSGTSALFTAISEVFGLPGYGESHVVPAFQRMIHQLRQYVEIFDNNPEDIMIKHMGAGPVEALLFDYVRNFYRDAYKGGGFVDKTPTGEAIYGAPLIESIFPDAYLIVTRRTGIEVVQSFRLKFSSDFADACLAWAEAMSGILHARTRCQRMIEIDQFDMANQPERTGRKIAAWLGYPERSDALGRFFARERIEKSSTHDWSRRQTLADVDWSPTEKATFTRICGRMMETFDYAM